MTFELNKFYKHSGGGVMHMIATAENPVMWMGSPLIAEDRDGNLSACGRDETSAQNWSEITQEEFMQYLSPRNNSEEPVSTPCSM